MSSASNSRTLTIRIERQPDGEYAAIDEANNDLGCQSWNASARNSEGAGVSHQTVMRDLTRPAAGPGLVSALLWWTPRCHSGSVNKGPSASPSVIASVDSNRRACLSPVHPVGVNETKSASVTGLGG